MGRKVSLCYTFMEKQLGWSDCFLPVPAGNQKNNLHNQSHWKPERKNQKVHEIKAFIPFGRCHKKTFIFHLWKLRRNGHSLFITGGWLWINLCLFLRTESKYKNKLTTEFCFYLHKILDSVILKNTQIKVCFLTFYYIKYIASEYLLIHIKRGWILSPLQTKSLKSCPSLRTLTYSWVSLYMHIIIH